MRVWRVLLLLGVMGLLGGNVSAQVAHDAASEDDDVDGSTSEGSFTWNHTPVGTPRGVFVCTFTQSTTDEVSGVTYGGTAMTAVVGGRALDDASSDLGDAKLWFLGSSIPTGEQAIVVTRTNNATVVWALAETVTAGADTEVTGIVLVEDVGTVAEQNVDDGSPGANSLRFACGHSSLSSPPAAGTNSTYTGGGVALIDFGARVAGMVRESTAGQGSRPVGFDDANTQGRAIVHFAVREAAAAASGVPCVIGGGVVCVPGGE